MASYEQKEMRRGMLDMRQFATAHKGTIENVFFVIVLAFPEYEGRFINLYWKTNAGMQ